MFVLLLTALASAGQPVVAVGNGLVAAPPKGFVAPEGASASSWVGVLADCLEEARPGGFPVVDRSRVGATAAAVARDAATLRELGPHAVVVAVGATEMARVEDPTAFAGELAAMVRSLRASGGPGVFLVGIVAPTVAQAGGAADQAAFDGRTQAWNEALARVAASDDGVWHVDIWKKWPRDAASREKLTQRGWALTDRAHARIGAVICEEIMKNLVNRGP